LKNNFISLTFLFSADPNFTDFGFAPKETPPNFKRNRSGVWKIWLWAYGIYKLAVSLKQLKIDSMLLLTAYMKSYTELSIAAKMYDLE